MATKRCGRCKVEKDIQLFSKDNQTISGLSCYCKSCQQKRWQKYRTTPGIGQKLREKTATSRSLNKLEMKNYLKRYYLTPKGAYTRYKSEAKTRKIEWDINYEQFCQFWQKPCHYCNDLIVTIGLDRFDNNKGYTLDNIVPCCAFCNSAKNIYSYKEFLQKIEKIFTKHCCKGVICGNT